MPRKCKEESRLYSKQYYADNREDRLLYARNKAKGISPVKRKKQEYCPIRNRKANLKCRYNLTIEQYNDMFAKQLGLCAICGVHQTEYKKTFHVDHCHTTGKIRGLLCATCNTQLGIYEKHKEVFKNYLQLREV